MTIDDYSLPEMQPVEEALEADRVQVANLSKNRAWIALRTHLYERRSILKERLIRGIFRKNAEPVDQRQIDYARGQIDMIEWMLTLPERTEADLARQQREKAHA